MVTDLENENDLNENDLNENDPMTESIPTPEERRPEGTVSANTTTTTQSIEFYYTSGSHVFQVVH